MLYTSESNNKVKLLLCVLCGKSHTALTVVCFTFRCQYCKCAVVSTNTCSQIPCSGSVPNAVSDMRPEQAYWEVASPGTAHTPEQQSMRWTGKDYRSRGRYFDKKPVARIFIHPEIWSFPIFKGQLRNIAVLHNRVVYAGRVILSPPNAGLQCSKH